MSYFLTPTGCPEWYGMSGAVVLVPDAFEVSFQDGSRLPIVVQGSRPDSLDKKHQSFELHLVNDKGSALYFQRERREFGTLADEFFQLRVERGSSDSPCRRPSLHIQKESVFWASELNRLIDPNTGREVSETLRAQMAKVPHLKVAWCIEGCERANPITTWFLPGIKSGSLKQQSNYRYISPQDYVWGDLDDPCCKDNWNLHWLVRFVPNHQQKGQNVALTLKFLTVEMHRGQVLKIHNGIRKAA